MNLHKALEEIRQWVGENKATPPYTEEGCRVSMANIPRERVVLKVDSAFPRDRATTNQCDLVLFYIDPTQNSIIGVPMELKGGKGDVDESEAIKQLRAGARMVDNYISSDIEIQIVLVLVHEGSIHKGQRNKLKTSRIRFRGEEIPINTTRCGYEGNLAQALAKSSKR